MTTSGKARPFVARDDESTHPVSVETPGERLRWLRKTLRILGRSCTYAVICSHFREEGWPEPAPEEFDCTWDELFGGGPAAGEGLAVKLPKVYRTGVGALLVRAARTLRGTFTVEQLAVAAWKLSPETVCIEGHPEHPDTKRVWNGIYGPGGLIRHGVLVRVPGGFRVAEGG